MSRRETVWVAVFLLMSLGSAVLGVGLAWTAASAGPRVAGIVGALPAVVSGVLLLLGGALVDRVDPRRAVLGSAGALAVLCLGTAMLPVGVASGPTVLVVLAVLLGVHAAVSSPATVTFSRLLSTDASFPRLLAAEQVAGQTALVGGRALGGIVVGAGGLALAAAVPAVAALVCVLVVLLVLTGVARPPRSADAPRERTTLAMIGAGARAIVVDPVLRPFVLLTAVVAGTIIPAVGVGLPLLLVERRADVAALGLLGAAVAGGVAAVALVVAVRGRWRTTWLVVVGGAVVAGCGAVVLALAPSDAVRLAGAVVIGVGQGLFATHGAPLVRRVPVEVFGRVQATQGAMQALAIAAGSAGIGAASAAWGAGPSLAVAGAVVGLAGVAAALGGFRPTEPDAAAPLATGPSQPAPVDS